MLHTTLTVRPPRSIKVGAAQPRVLVQLTQGSFFTILPKNVDDFLPEWHSGNIYDMNRAPPNAVELPGVVHTDKPTEFDFFVSGDYEVHSKNPLVRFPW